MAVLSLVVLVPLLVAVSFGPGFFVVRRLGWTPLETLAASVALSLIGLFVVTFTGFWIGAPKWIDGGILAGAVAMTAATWRDARELWRHRIVRRAILALFALQLWTVLLLSLIGQYGGGNSCCDWLEHYQRTTHFIDPWPVEFRYITRYLFPSRPPLMNAVAAYVLGWVGPTFPSFQLVFSLFNVLALLACCLASGVVSRSGRVADPVLMAVMLGANPMFFVNTTFPWTKVLTAFMVILALSLYVVGWRSRDRARLTGAFLALGAAVLTHYSAAPYALLIGAHYLVTTVATPAARSRIVGWRTTGTILLPGVLLVMIWIVYATSTYGLDGLVRNVSFEGGQSQSLLQHLATRAHNLADTFVPRAYSGYDGYPEDATPWRWLSDQVFTIYQSNAVFSIGLISGPMVLALAWMAVGRRPWTAERRFWCVFVPLIWILGVIVHGDREDTGLAMISLQPITYLALAFLATRLAELPIWARRLWYIGALADVGVGITMALWFETTIGEWARTPNWTLKADEGLFFLGDYVRNSAGPVVVAAVVVIGLAAARFAARQILVSPTPEGPTAS